MNFDAVLSPTQPMPAVPVQGAHASSSEPQRPSPMLYGMQYDTLSALPMTEHLLDRLRAAGL